MIDMFQNKDYYGTEIRNPNDSTVKQIGELLQYQAQQFIPFTITNLIQRQKAGDSSWSAYLQSFSGITPAPGYITRSPIQTRIYNLYDLRNGGGTQNQAQSQAQQLKSQIRNAYWLGDSKKANDLLQQAIDQGIIKPNGAAQFIKDADLPNDLKLFQLLPDTDQASLLKDMQLYELQRYAWYAKTTIQSRLSTLSDNAKNFVDMEQKGEITKPTWSKGKIENQ